MFLSHRVSLSPPRDKNQINRSNKESHHALLRFDLIEGRSESELKKILDVTHEVLLDTLQVPKHDRYQVVHEHKRSRMVIEDTGIGFARSDKIVALQITSRPRKREMKQAFYRLLVERLSPVAEFHQPTWS
jgi:Tautomerase enzyme